MVLELSKAVCFFLCIASIYEAAMHALFVPGVPWEMRLLVAGIRLAFAAYVCFMSGLVFTLPARTNPDRGQRLTASLPVRLFCWSMACIVVLFLASWYLGDLAEQASPFISDRTLQRF